ncbi:MAG: hypothetical protein OZ919_10590 [Xanthomonadaceae bacterium]|nr:hypothetical protein [Xanthomonadaceae bacterium]
MRSPDRAEGTDPAKLYNWPAVQYLAPMLRRLRSLVSSCLRLTALVVLALGLLVKPVLVVACEIGDIQLGQDGGALVVEGVAGVGDADAHEVEDGCCPGQACGECCTMATVMPAGDAPAWIAYAPAGVAGVSSDEVAPAPRRKTFRPPITV